MESVDTIWVMDSECCIDCGELLNPLETSGQCYRCAEAEREIDEEDWYDGWGSDWDIPLEEVGKP